jgi:hypothetical protein
MAQPLSFLFFSFFLVAGHYPPVESGVLNRQYSPNIFLEILDPIVVRDNDKPPSCPEVKLGARDISATEFCQIFLSRWIY